MKAKYLLGRYRNTETGQTVNVWKMKRGSFDVLAYRPQGKPAVVISDYDFYSRKLWASVNN